MVQLICGVGLILRNAQGQIYVLRELMDKPLIRKQAGMLSFPLETVNLNHGETVDEAVRRLILEELGPIVRVENIRGLGAYNILPGVLILIYQADCNNPVEDFVPTDSDVEAVGWMHPEQLLESFCRVEVAPVIQDFLDATNPSE